MLIYGPGAYFMDLMAIVQRTIAAWHPDLGPLSLANRSPDLWNANRDITREVLESVVAVAGGPPSVGCFTR
jgi:hypothetical protein